jgi:hypothetical protein
MLFSRVQFLRIFFWSAVRLNIENFYLYLIGISKWHSVERSRFVDKIKSGKDASSIFENTESIK